MPSLWLLLGVSNLNANGGRKKIPRNYKAFIFHAVSQTDELSEE